MKFKVWDKKELEWIDEMEHGFTAISCDGTTLFISECGGFEEMDSARFETVFSSGLNDRNGVEGIDGSIVEYGERYFVLRWIEECASFALSFYIRGEVQSDEPVNEYEFSDMEIVGHLFTDPGLVGVDDA